MTTEKEPPAGQHEWERGWHGQQGLCSRCGARASQAGSGRCAGNVSRETTTAGNVSPEPAPEPAPSAEVEGPHIVVRIPIAYLPRALEDAALTYPRAGSWRVSDAGELAHEVVRALRRHHGQLIDDVLTEVFAELTGGFPAEPAGLKRITQDKETP